MPLGQRRGAHVGLRERGAGRGRREVITGRCRLAHALPDRVDLGASGLHRHQGAHAQLPFQALVPEDEQGLGVVRELKGFGAAVVGEGDEGLRARRWRRAGPRCGRWVRRQGLWWPGWRGARGGGGRG